MKNLTLTPHTFINPQSGPIRVVELNNQPWFCLNDLCQTLHVDKRAIRRRLTNSQRQNLPVPDTNGRRRLTAFVNESGLYDAILDSRKPQAKAFRQWVTTDVLPAIRHHGAYLHTTPNDTPETIQAKAYQAVLQANEKLRKQLEHHQHQLEQKNQELAAQDLQLEEQKLQLATQNTTIENQNLQLADQDLTIEHQQHQLTAQNTTIENQNLQLADQDLTIEHQQLQLTAQQPSVNYAQALLTTPDAITINEMAKILIQAGYITGQNRLFQWLRKHHYLCSRPCFRNLPTQEYMTRGYFVVREHIGVNIYGNTVISHTTHVTPKGQHHLLNHFAHHHQ